MTDMRSPGKLLDELVLGGGGGGLLRGLPGESVKRPRRRPH
ncbi:hypothetical protein [Streptomyces sp. MBT53]|nr:hypothetical protein [Streptomyces sp. MBT53]